MSLNIFHGIITWFLWPLGFMGEEVFSKREVKSVFKQGCPFMWCQLHSASLTGFVNCDSHSRWSNLHWPPGRDRRYIRATASLIRVKMMYGGENGRTKPSYSYFILYWVTFKTRIKSDSPLPSNSISLMNQKWSQPACALPVQTYKVGKIIPLNAEVTVDNLQGSGRATIHRQFIKRIKSRRRIWLGHIWPVEQRFIIQQVLSKRRWVSSLLRGGVYVGRV